MRSRTYRFQQIFKHRSTDLLLLFSIISPCLIKYIPETLKSQLFHSFTFCGNIPKTSSKRPYNTNFVEKYGIDEVLTPVVESKDTLRKLHTIEGYIKLKDFTLEELNYEIINFDFGYSEMDLCMSPSSLVMRDII